MLQKAASVFGVQVAGVPVCRGHAAPLDFLATWYFDRPSLSLVHGPRGGGKSYLSALSTHFDSIRHPKHGTRILGGSLAQSQQIYNALREFCEATGDDQLATLTKTQARYFSGSDVSMLAASRTSVRGPHIPTLRLDEVDEIDPEIREAALGMCMARGGIPAMVVMTSTWHRVGGPMGELVEKAESGAFPLHRFCTFEVLERCPESRSGLRIGGPDLYEHCPSCPLRPWCHEELVPDPVTGIELPKAKRSAGHYAIESLAQKVQAASLRTFEADYLCKGPKADGLWFKSYDDQLNVREVEYRPRLPLHLAIDSGVSTGAVFFQVETTLNPATGKPDSWVNVLLDYFVEDVPAETVARQVRELARQHFGDRIDVFSTDSAGGSRNPVGPTVIRQYDRGGLKNPRFWPKHAGSVLDQLNLLDALILGADGWRALRVHPRCQWTRRALQNYRRAKRGGQWIDQPEDPQHPHEELIDSLRGGLKLALPDGRGVPKAGRPAPANIFT